MITNEYHTTAKCSKCLQRLVTVNAWTPSETDILRGVKACLSPGCAIPGGQGVAKARRTVGPRLYARLWSRDCNAAMNIGRKTG